jgi:hypothetical protein
MLLTQHGRLVRSYHLIAVLLYAACGTAFVFGISSTLVFVEEFSA